ncbi:hypothetical protein METBIDRAFT_32142 [Metschnikowia bicuspidata var. bicuspidata NRRL YB-4993]|uniref:ABC transporter domain-containing protein n=1 Tax=Metschnikowia bicuspidata var. bicuspidata NRRL YB-4993 TaxID=869754 RepID=A0A1A0HCL3_9ASCO|nr:hypothetical protein METBIDRAFT_32142 [Metschnikowia bicuspidata var. bicuspidata NRRL YB-4993]OBA21663.1 hypothetical protein METBIDRAFT_32142 [Metschnikowia bicuspidata var. bicuspidata NRRL YB-4993]
MRILKWVFLSLLTVALQNPSLPNNVRSAVLLERISNNAAIREIFDPNVEMFLGQPDDKTPSDDCPPCFNCNLPNFECTQFSQCNTFTGMCECRDGYGGMDCSVPLCGGLEDGNGNRPMRKHDTCDCKNGWGGINCNLCTEDSACDAFVPEGLKGTCYKGGLLVNKFHQMCDVTNKKIVAILDGKIPQATFSCNKTAETCDFQFWIDQKESFYCDLNQCKYEFNARSNTTHYNCESVACKCLPDRMLCGEKGLIDISEFLTETIRGPGDFTCDVNAKNCRFSEPSMNDLISSVFGDPYITLHCDSGECIHKSEVPGYDIPQRRKFTINNFITIGAVLIVSSVIISWSVYSVGKSPLFSLTSASGYVPSTDEHNPLSENYTPAAFSFKNVSYTLKNGTKVLNDVYGLVHPGQCLAIMGGSGAGKTTLLDILAAKKKRGSVEGEIYVNGQVLSPSTYKSIVGFVDQEDHLIPTLTVYETVLNSALLRLPRAMSFAAKVSRVTEVLNELRILSIKDRVIGSDFDRGISGGEKRRVSIACELVTSPSILFLDEPTSGLDAYNAKNVIDSLVKLAKDFNRTIVFTIHQPRSNIVSLFDKLLLLSEGDLIYSGDMINCNDYFGKHGYPCPLGYNIADFLIDITVDHKKVIRVPNEASTKSVHDRFLSNTTGSTDITREWEHFAVHRDEYNYQRIGDSSENGDELIRLNTKLPQKFEESPISIELRREILELAVDPKELNLEQHMLQKASFFTQLSILSSRTFKNLYRNPRLLLTNYVLSLAVGLFCGFLYYDVSNDISGFQNRLGVFFFVLALFGFSSLTGLHSFAQERIIFIRERANNYYHPASYYVSKIICDLLPLRVLPPVILLSIMYPMIGLTMEHNGFLKALAILVLFNLAVAIEVLIVGIVIKDPGTSTIIGVLILLFSLLFAGLFINSEDLKTQMKWLEWISLFHYAYEALAINEVKDLILKEKKYGLSIEVPGAVILSTFGFNVSAFWNDILFLVGWGVTFVVLGYVFLHSFTYERR